MERLLAISLSHNGATPVTLVSNTYDALGRLATSSVNNGGSSTAYAYNVRGWAQSVTNAHFYEWIHYQDAPSGGTPCWGGGIIGGEPIQIQLRWAEPPHKSRLLVFGRAMER